MRPLSKISVILFVLFVGSIMQTNAWNGIIAQSGDILNITKWNELANQVLISLTQSGNTFTGKLIVGTNDNQPVAIETNNTERVTVLSGGNVGINQTNPQTRFEINSAVANTAGLKFSQLTHTSSTLSGSVITLGVTSSGIVTPVPNGFPTVLRTTATQANTSSTGFVDISTIQIPLVSWRTYVFQAYIVYNAGTAATGMRVRMNSPNNFWYSATINTAATASQYRAFYNDVTNSLASTASIWTTGNVAVLEGTIIPTSTGTGIIQFASETAGIAITIQPDSLLYYYSY